MNLDHLPEEITILNQWVCSFGEQKMPIQPLTGFPASSTNPLTWSDFKTARGVVERTQDTGYVGFVFNGNGIVGIDIDKGYDDGFISPIACDIIGKCKSYTEKSKSGRGFHILIKGDIPFKGRNNRNGVEIYKQSRFFIMTGDVLLYNTIVENQAAIDYILDKYFPDMRDCDSKKTMYSRIYTPTWEKPDNSQIKLRPVYPRIPDGCRNISLTSLAGMLHNQGYGPRQIYDELVYCNTVACEPMLDEREIETIVNSVTRYKR